MLMGGLGGKGRREGGGRREEGGKERVVTNDQNPQLPHFPFQCGAAMLCHQKMQEPNKKLLR